METIIEIDEIVDKSIIMQSEMHRFIDKFMPLVKEKNKKRKNKITYNDMTIIYLLLKITELERKLETQFTIKNN